MANRRTPRVLDLELDNFTVIVEVNTSEDHRMRHGRISHFETFCLVQVEGDIESDLNCGGVSERETIMTGERTL